jgi:vancomycin resistance protein YoaR
MRKKIKKKKASKKKFLILFLFLTILGAASYTSYLYFTVNQWDKLIYPGVKVENADLSGKTKEEALNIINKKYLNQVIKKKINIIWNDKTYIIDYSKLDARYNTNDVIDEAYLYGKDKGLFEKYKLVKNEKEKLLRLKFVYNSDVVNQVISDMKKDINREPIDATITMVKRGVFQVTPEVIGLQLEEDKLKKEIISKINGNLENDMINIEAPVKENVPKYTEAELSKINSKISEYSTGFTYSGEGRSTNVRLATAAINGKVLMPGDVFSFNGTVGERTADRGYKSAHVIVGEKLIDGLGGGICQVSSTIYNTVIRAGLNSVERTNHTMVSGYVNIGQDATVDWGNIDYKFKNTFEYPIYIEAFTYNKHVYFKFYSNDSLNNMRYEIRSEIYKTFEPEVEIKKDPEKYEDEEEIVVRALTGYKVKVYRNIYKDGNFVKKEVVSDNYYPPRNGKIIKGTKKREELIKDDQGQDTELKELLQNSN